MPLNLYFCIMARVREYSATEELANSLSHALGILLGIVGGYILLRKASADGNMWAIGSVIAYLFGMLSSYISSTWYHACRDEKKKEKLRKFDHAAIYLHIAGTYIPFTLVVLRQEGAWGWALFAVITLSAIAGVCASFRGLKTHSYFETVCYVLMGGSILVAIKPLIDVLSQMGSIDSLYWLLGGGASYVVGAIFYSLAKTKYMHTVFHFFVLGGSICHIMAIYMVV